MHLTLRRVLTVLLFMAAGVIGRLAVTPGHAAPRTLAASAFEVKTGEWYYDPKEITVEASAMVSITLRHVGSASIPHDIKFELENGRVAASKRINGGGTDVLGFAAPAEPGEYVFYCSVGNHRSRGMEGKLIVTGASTFTIKTGEWYYDPKEFSVAAATMVSITLQHVGSASIPHDIKFELENGRVAASKRINGGGTDVLGFAAPAEPGEYVFYCSVGNHRSRGMEGKLIVTGAGTVVVPSPGITATVEATPGITATAMLTPSPQPSALPDTPTPSPMPSRWWTYLPQLLRNELLNQR